MLGPSIATQVPDVSQRPVDRFETSDNPDDSGFANCVEKNSRVLRANRYQVYVPEVNELAAGLELPCCCLCNAAVYLP